MWQNDHRFQSNDDHVKRDHKQKNKTLDASSAASAIKNVIDLSKETQPKNEIFCSLCGNKFDSQINLVNHYVQMHKIYVTSECLVCDQLLISQIELVITCIMVKIFLTNIKHVPSLYGVKLI